MSFEQLVSMDSVGRNVQAAAQAAMKMHDELNRAGKPDTKKDGNAAPAGPNKVPDNEVKDKPAAPPAVPAGKPKPPSFLDDVGKGIGQIGKSAEDGVKNVTSTAQNVVGGIENIRKADAVKYPSIAKVETFLGGELKQTEGALMRAVAEQAIKDAQNKAEAVAKAGTKMGQDLANAGNKVMVEGAKGAIEFDKNVKDLWKSVFK